MSPEQKLARLLSRIPADATVTLQRGPGENWQARVALAGIEGVWSGSHGSMADALEESWRLNREPA